MGKAFAILLVGALVAVFLVPFHGLTLYQRGARRFFSAPVETRQKRATLPPRTPVRRERVGPETPKERLSDRDRKALDRLVSETRPDSR
jgi:hypothetical protein